MNAAPEGWDLLFTDRGSELLERIGTELAAGADAARLNAGLRRDGIEPPEVAALLTQAELRRAAAAKFGALAQHLLFTRAGLEQASRAPVAALHAERFAAAGLSSVADLGCGLGAESIALIASGIEARPVELDPFTARLAEHNLGVAARRGGMVPPAVRVGDAERLGRDGADAAFLDPARRTAGHSDTRRLASPDDYSPSLGFAFGLAAEVPTGVKLGPGLEHELLPDNAEAQWVSVDGQLVETGVWFGPLARPGVRRSALVLSGDKRAELRAPGPAPDAESRPLGEFLIEPDGAVIRARLIGALAEELGAGMLSEGIAYLTADTEPHSPFARGFRIVEELPVREKELRKALAERGIGSLEIKKRGADVDPALLRKRLRLSGPHRGVLFLTRAGGRHVALLAERV
ncbi:SAM-dependent methyltransferase [Leucobacter sp. CSA2]|uniref:SAM-dependent methyltransferase n=1 Tax=Leucobacter edaphi TaxID=2796472 RepID=A0A934QCF9_9MICO|nr:SAM-dependent methyltransferase [Leucobacter edaphi]MBK0420717.1 SAM-dependent methyltransferase [Leucobacter edaphi]